MALSAHSAEQADAYSSARTPYKKPFASKKKTKKTLLKVQRDQKVQVKCWQGRMCRYTSVFFSLMLLKCMNAFA